MTLEQQPAWNEIAMLMLSFGRLLKVSAQSYLAISENSKFHFFLCPFI
jgi:hypothetical protein